MQQRLTIVGLGVKDLNVSSEFYQEKFGWEKLGSSTDTIVLFQLNGILLSLYPRDILAEDATVDSAGEGFKGFTLAYNARTKEEVDGVIADLEDKGVRIVKHPQEVFWGGYSSYVADLDDNLWEIAFNPCLPLNEEGNAEGR